MPTSQSYSHLLGWGCRNFPFLMDNNDQSSPTSPGSSGAPISGGVIKWILGIIVIAVIYRVGTLYFNDPQVLTNFAQTIQHAINSVSTSVNVPGTSSQSATTKATNSILDNATHKVTTVLSCINYADQSVRNTIDQYQRYVDFNTPTKTTFTGSYSDASWQNCDKDITTALTFESNTPNLDKAMRNFQTQGNATVSAFKDVTSYYKQKSYLDDNFTFGKAKDAALIQLSLSYIQASDTFRDAVDAQEDINNNAHIAELSADPAAQNQVLALQMFMQSKTVLHELYKEPIISSALEKSITDLTTIQTKFKEVVLASIKNDTSKYSSWNGISGKIDSFIAASKDVWRLVRDNKPLPESNEGSLDRAIEQFNNLVSSYNMTNNIPQYRL